MKVVIEIPEDEYIRLKKIYETNCKYTPNTWLPSYMTAIGNGTPLPKGHGRLIDADDVNNHIIGFVDLRSCPTIIEADKAESEDKE